MIGFLLLPDQTCEEEETKRIKRTDVSFPPFIVFSPFLNGVVFLSLVVSVLIRSLGGVSQRTTTFFCVCHTDVKDPVRN